MQSFEFSSAITPVFSVTGSFRNQSNMPNVKKSLIFQYTVLFNIFVETMILFLDSFRNKNLKEQHLF